MTNTLACSLNVGDTVQIGRLRGRVAYLAVAPARDNHLGMIIATLKNGRKLILAGSHQVKIKTSV